MKYNVSRRKLIHILAMNTIIKEARSIEDLLGLKSHDMPYLFDRIFNVEGEEVVSLSRKKFKLLKSIDEEIQKMLHKDEKVYFITCGLLTSLVEEYFIWGPYALYINWRTIIFTTQRVLLLQISELNRRFFKIASSFEDNNIKPMKLKFQIHYAAIASISRTRLGNCKITFKDSNALTLAYLPKKDCEFMKEEFEEIQRKHAFSPSGSEGLENLCPYCYGKVEEFPQNCRHCWRSFKSASNAGWLSLIFPGLGDLYLGYYGAAIFKIIIFAILWAVMASGVFFRNLHFLEPAAIALIFFVCIHGINAFQTHHVGQKGIYPAEK